MTKVLLNSKVIHLAMALLLLYIPFALLLSPTQLYLLSGSVLLSTSLTAIYAYWPVVRYTMKSDVSKIDKTEVLTMGIILLFLAVASREAYITFWREVFPISNPRPEDYYYPLSFIRYMSAVAAVLTLCARRMVFGPSKLHRVPGWPASVLSVFAGLIIGTLMILR